MREPSAFNKASEANRPTRPEDDAHWCRLLTPTLQLVTYGAMAFVMFLVALSAAADATCRGSGFLHYSGQAFLAQGPAGNILNVSANIQKGIAARKGVFEQLDEAALKTGTQEQLNVTA